MTDKAEAISLKAIQFLLGFIALCLAIYIFRIGGSILIPFVIAVFVWYLINSIAKGMSRLTVAGLHLPRFLCFLLAISFLVLGLWFIFHLISENIADVAAAAPIYQKNFEKIVPKIMILLHLEQEETIREIMHYFNLGTIITALAKMFTGVAGKTLVVLFYTGFLLYEQRFFNRKLDEMIVSRETENHVHRILENIDIKIQRWISVKTFVSALTGILTWAVLCYYNVDFAEFWGLLAFVLNFIPYLGPLTAAVVPAVIALIQFGSVSVFVDVLLGLSVIQMVTGIVFDQKLMGDSLNLSPVVVISFLAMWGMIWGLPGVFLSIPILATVMIALSQFPRTKAIAILLSKTGEIEKDESGHQSRKRKQS